MGWDLRPAQSIIERYARIAPFESETALAAPAAAKQGGSVNRFAKRPAKCSPEGAENFC